MRPKPRYQAKRIPKEVVGEEVVQLETMREEPPLSIHDSPLHNEEEVPLAVDMADLGEQHGYKVE